ncbi:19783_t:CDS:2 [Gigaspora margarita]|uniref:19783_t:CDS:1 n=1 Tax=Gigaspora margarita TaxID=4874 RepID=A0ABM8W539_GIGMA|nr:19783_t:CDS:2 [Gigaspora margarita]
MGPIVKKNKNYQDIFTKFYEHNVNKLEIYYNMKLVSNSTHNVSHIDPYKTFFKKVEIEEINNENSSKKIKIKPNLSIFLSGIFLIVNYKIVLFGYNTNMDSLYNLRLTSSTVLQQLIDAIKSETLIKPSNNKTTTPVNKPNNKEQQITL